MKHFTTPEFWECFGKLPEAIQTLARKNYQLLKDDPRHSSLYFKKIGQYRSVRIGRHYRALDVESDGDIIWFWTGTHAEYDRLTG